MSGNIDSSINIHQKFINTENHKNNDYEIAYMYKYLKTIKRRVNKIEINCFKMYRNTKNLFDKFFENKGSDMPKSSDMDRIVGINKPICEYTSVSGPTNIANYNKKKKKKNMSKIASPGESTHNLKTSNIEKVLLNIFKDIDENPMPNYPKSKFTEHDWIVEAFHSKFKSEMGRKWLLNDEDLIQVVNTVNFMDFEDYNSIGMNLPQLMYKGAIQPARCCKNNDENFEVYYYMSFEDSIYNQFQRKINELFDRMNSHQKYRENKEISKYVMTHQKIFSLKNLLAHADALRINLKSRSYNKTHLLKIIFVEKYKKYNDVSCYDSKRCKYFNLRKIMKWTLFYPDQMFPKLVPKLKITDLTNAAAYQFQSDLQNREFPRGIGLDCLLSRFNKMTKSEILGYIRQDDYLWKIFNSYMNWYRLKYQLNNKIITDESVRGTQLEKYVNEYKRLEPMQKYYSDFFYDYSSVYENHKLMKLNINTNMTNIYKNNINRYEKKVMQQNKFIQPSKDEGNISKIIHNLGLLIPDDKKDQAKELLKELNLRDYK